MIMLFITKLSLAIFSLVILYMSMFGVLRLFDKALGIDFKEAFNTIETDSRAMALYYGLRILGVSLAVGLVICFCLIL